MVVGYLAAVILSMALCGAASAVSLCFHRACTVKRSWSLLAFIFVLWSAAFLVLNLSDTPGVVLPKIAAGLSLAFFALLCHSSLLPLPGGWKKIGPAAIYGACLLLLAATALLPEAPARFSRQLGFWTHGAPLNSPLYLAQSAFCLVSGSAGLAALLSRASKANGDRAAAFLRASLLGAGLALYYANQIALPLAGGMAAPYCTPLVFSIWLLGILPFRSARAIQGPGVAVGAAQAPREGTRPIPAYAVLVDSEGRILEANEEAQAMLGRNAEALKGAPLASVMRHAESLGVEIRRMAAAKAGKSSCQVDWITERGIPGHGRVRISAALNAFGRATGFLITPFAHGEIGRLKGEYSLTEREIEVIHYAAQGLPNHTIARELSITERTVKAHLTNIYNKMGIDGKFKLMNRLKDFDV